jgi:hypothetical protein
MFFRIDPGAASLLLCAPDCVAGYLTSENTTASVNKAMVVSNTL